MNACAQRFGKPISCCRNFLFDSQSCAKTSVVGDCILTVRFELTSSTWGSIEDRRILRVGRLRTMMIDEETAFSDVECACL